MNRGRPGSGPLRTGLIGAGRMGSFHAATLATRLDCTELVAIADVDEERAASLAGDLGVPRVYADAEDLLADGQVEAVVIAAPARAHAALVLGALEAGKAVFCEKPMAVTSEEAEQVVRAARGRGWRCRWGSTGGSPRTSSRLVRLRRTESSDRSICFAPSPVTRGWRHQSACLRGPSSWRR